MGERQIKNLEEIPLEATADPSPLPQPAPLPQRITLNYPKPTLISVILEEIAQWSGRSFVLEPGQNRKIQIFSTRALTPTEAYDLFAGALSTVGLRAVQVGNVTKIVPIQGITMV